MKKQRMSEWYSIQANAAVQDGTMKAQWKQAYHRARAKKMMYEHTFLPSVRKFQDIDGNINFAWKNSLTINHYVQDLAESVASSWIMTGNKDALASRQKNTVLQAQENRRAPDVFEGLYDFLLVTITAKDYLESARGK